MNRCRWLNTNNPVYVKYHDEEWCVPSFDDNYLFEMLVLESFQAGLSWECILNKRKYFREAFDNFNYEVISKYNDIKVDELLNNKNIVRNKLKIKATINNAKVFIDIRDEFGSFSNYIWSYTNNIVLKHVYLTSNELSDSISKDLYRRGMRFVGSVIIYSYLQAIGVINDHDRECDLYLK